MPFALSVILRVSSYFLCCIFLSCRAAFGKQCYATIFLVTRAQVLHRVVVLVPCPPPLPPPPLFDTAPHPLGRRPFRVDNTSPPPPLPFIDLVEPDFFTEKYHFTVSIRAATMLQNLIGHLHCHCHPLRLPPVPTLHTIILSK